MNGDNKWILGRPIAHRGLHDSNFSVAENSILSFKKAIEGNYPIGLDVLFFMIRNCFVFYGKQTMGGLFYREGILLKQLLLN